MSRLMNAARILLTGGTGIVGAEVVRELLRRPDPPELLALMRGTPDEIEAKTRWLGGWAGLPADRASRLQVLRGDMTQPDLGLSAPALKRAHSVTAVLHAGAVTRFDQTRDQALLNNLHSTRQVLAFARRCPRVDRIGLVSTAFVAGRRQGVIRESELDLAADFNNEYEHSKALAEHEARLAMRDLPIAIYRLSVVVGRRTDGHISRLSGIYPVLRLFHEGLLAMFPGGGEQHIDLIPSDYAAAAMCYLLADAFVAGSTYQLCTGPDRSFTSGELFPAIDAYLARADPAWRRRGQQLPLPVSAEAFRHFVGIVNLTGNPRLRQIVEQTRTITRLLEAPKSFHTQVLDHALRAVPALTLGHAREWLEPSIAWAVKSGWKPPARAVLR
jgi:nucleoside-diphosphate-sugar epimerase